MSYLTLKLVHVAFVTLSGLLFGLRGAWMWTGSARLQAPWVRIAPHVIDTLLLASGITLAVLSRQYPWYAPWLAAKLFMLLVYIGLGMVAIRRGRTPGIRRTAFVAAVAVFAYMIGLAVTKDLLLGL